MTADQLLFAACEEAERELAALPLPKRVRVYVSGFGAVENWITRRAAEILAERLKTARGIATGLFPMIDRATWQASGGDDGQGHYEGEYWAEQMEQEMASWKAEGRPDA